MLSVERRREAGLLGAVEALAGAASIDDVVAVLRTHARKLIGADGIAVILRDGEECHYVEEDAIGPLWKGQRFPLTSCVSGWAMLQRESVAIRDIAQDDRVPYEFYRPTFVRSMAMVPVRRDDPVGAIGAYWSDHYEAPPAVIAILERLARAAATAIENVRLVAALSQALSDAELARDELRHRAKNAYAATQALAFLSLPAEHFHPFNARVGALARAHGLLDQRLARSDSIALADLVDAELQPYASDRPGRLALSGEHVALSGHQAVALGLVLNELATNSLKYGALSVPDGRLALTWRLDGRSVVMDWQESHGPEIGPSVLESFGSHLLRRLVEGQLGGAIERQMQDSGVTCRIEFRPIGS